MSHTITPFGTNGLSKITPEPLSGSAGQMVNDNATATETVLNTLNGANNLTLSCNEFVCNVIPNCAYATNWIEVNGSTLVGDSHTLAIYDPIGTPTNGQELTIRITEIGGADVSLSFGATYANFAAVSNIPLGGECYLSFKYNDSIQRWELNLQSINGVIAPDRLGQFPTADSFLRGDGQFAAITGTDISSGTVPAAHNLTDNSEVISADGDLRRLINADGSTLAYDWGGGILYDNGGTDSINLTNRTLLDTGAQMTVDYNNRQLLVSGGGTAVDWYNYQLKAYNADLDDYILSADWSIRNLYNPSGSLVADYSDTFKIWNYNGDPAVCFDASQMQLISAGQPGGTLRWNSGEMWSPDNASTYVLNWFNCQAKDSSGVTAIGWSDRYLANSTTSTVLDWENGICYDNDSQPCVKWIARELDDNSGNIAVDFNNRRLYQNDGSTVALDWSSGITLGSLDASSITSGTIATARLGSGTADSTTYLRGDNTWQTVSGGSITDLTFTGGYVSSGVTICTGSTTLTSSNCVVLCNTGSTGFTITLPGSLVTGQTFKIKKISASNTLTLVSGSGWTIDGAASQTYTSNNAFVTVMAKGPSTGYYVIG